MKLVSTGSAIHSHGFYAQKMRRRKILFIASLILSIVVLCLLLYLSRDSRVLIKEITVDESIADKEEIINRTMRELEGYYYFVIPRSNALLYPRHRINEMLLEEFPRIKSVDLDLKAFKTLNLRIEERAPFAVYCTNPDCYLLDEDGFIFALALPLSNGSYLIYTTSVTIADPIGKKYMESKQFRELANFISTLTALNIYSKSINVSSDDYSIYLESGAEIIWSRDTDLLIVRANLEAFLTSDAIKSQENFFDRVSRLDLRTENKVFYRFRD